MNKELNRNAPVYCNGSLTIRATPEKVWAVLTDLENWAGWNTKIAYAKLDSAARPGVAFTWKVNGAFIRSVFQQVEPDKMLSWRGVTFGGSAVHVWQLEKRDGFTCVRVEESMDGWLIKLFKKKMNNDLRQDMQFWLEALKRECEKA